MGVLIMLTTERANASRPSLNARQTLHFQGTLIRDLWKSCLFTPKIWWWGNEFTERRHNAVDREPYPASFPPTYHT